MKLFIRLLLLLSVWLPNTGIGKTLASNTMYVDAGQIYTAAGEIFVMRGFNEMFVWSEDVTGERTIPQIAQTGANALRLVWDLHAHNINDLHKLINNTIAHKMVAIPECHNATGKWGAQLQACIDFWQNPDVIEAIESHRQWTILNIANEAGDHNITDEMFIEMYGQAIKDLRRWGYSVPIMIDASKWGQDIDQLLRVGTTLLAIDPLQNLMFATHSYWSSNVAIENYHKVVHATQELGIAVIVGEGPSITKVGQCDDPTPLPYLEGMQILQQHQVGWLNWSWGQVPNSDCNDFNYFDITVNGEFGRWSHLPGAHVTAIDPNSVMQTSKRPISFFKDGVVPVSGVYLHTPTLDITVGESMPYKVIIAPANASDKSYELNMCKNADVLDINEQQGLIIGKSTGRCRITAYSESSKLSWSITINVTST